MAASRNATEIDIHVGSRVRVRRQLLGMSQTQLGEALGVTFQQVQKYERGTNRVGASRLYKISEVLDVPIAFFFDGLARPNRDDAAESESVISLMDSAYGIKLASALQDVASRDLREQILSLVRSLKGR